MMAALGHKFILFILIIVNLASCHENKNHTLHFVHNNKLEPIKDFSDEEIRFEPTTTTTIRTIQNCPLHYTFFDLSSVGLQRIGQDFIESSEIITLTLENNEIHDISPFAFRSMRNLRQLNLSGNRIPKEKLLSFVGTSMLETLIINNNNDIRKSIMKGSKEYVSFQSLKYLHLRNSELQDFKLPFQIITPILSHLYVSNNNINSSEIFNNIPATLTHLHLDNNLINRIEHNKLRHLRELVMNNNVLTEICFGNCQNWSISLKGAVQMQNLSLSRNLITKVSVDAFNDTKYLTNLDLSGNNIFEIIKHTFNNTLWLKTLSLADNMITNIPDICPMSHLRSFNLTGNHISAVHSNSFCFSRSLEYLYLANNLINAIESQAFVMLQSLKYLDLSRNRLRQFPSQILHSWLFEELHLEHNRFTNMRDISLTDLKKLKHVYLDENPMTLFKVEYFHSLPRHLIIHMKNTHILDKENICAKCKCEDYEDDSENGSDDD